MVLFWCRVKQSQLRVLSNQLKRCYFQIHGRPLVNHDTNIRAVNNPSWTSNKAVSEFGNNVRFFAAPVQVKPKYEEKDKGRPKMNEQISAQYVRLVTDEGHGVVSRSEALQRARRLNVDLVEVQPDGKPPVCKLMDYNKEMYTRHVKEKEQTKKKSELVLRKGALKEVRITCKIDKNDLQTKADTVKRLTERGYRVKCMAVGTADQDLGGLLSRLSALIDDFCLVESETKVEAKQAYIVVRHVKFGPLKKGPGKKKVLVPLENGNASQIPENLDQNLDSETEEELEPDEHTVNVAPETSNRYGQAEPGPENRYAAARQTNTNSAPKLENRYATRQTNTPGPGARSDESGEAQVNRYKKGPPVQGGSFGRENQAGFRR